MQLLFFILFFPKVIGIIIGTYYFKQLVLPFKLLFFQLCFAFTAELLGAYIGLVLGQHNIWMFNLYWLIDIWLVCLPAILLLKNIKLKYTSWILLSISVIIWVLNVYLKGIHTSANLYFLFYCIAALLIYLFLLLDSGIFNGNKLTRQPIFWVAISTLIYFGCMIPYKGFELYLFANDMKLARTLFNINIGLGALRYLFLAISFYLLGSQSKNNFRNTHGN